MKTCWQIIWLAGIFRDGYIDSIMVQNNQHFDNIIYLPGEPIGCEYLCSEPWKEGGVFMSTYEEFMVLLTMGLLIVAILNYMDHKK